MALLQQRIKKDYFDHVKEAKERLSKLQEQGTFEDQRQSAVLSLSQRPSFLQPLSEIGRFEQEMLGIVRDRTASMEDDELEEEEEEEESVNQSRNRMKREKIPIEEIRANLRKIQEEQTKEMTANRAKFMSPEEKLKYDKLKIQMRQMFTKFFSHLASKQNVTYF